MTATLANPRNIKPAAPVILHHRCYKHRIHMAARYVVRAQGPCKGDDIVCDVIIPAGIQHSWHRRAVERVVKSKFPGYTVPSRGEQPWYLEHHEEDEF